MSLARLAVRIGIVIGAAAVVPRLWSARHAGAWFDGRLSTQERLAAGVTRWTEESSSPRISSGATVIDGEWVFATYQMAALGFAQVALEHPETRPVNAKRIDACVEKMLSEKVRAFDRDLWKEDPLDSLDGDNDHAAYLGYMNLAMSYERLVDPKTRHAAMNDRITAALVRRLERTPSLMLQTYPNDIYPPDNTAVAGSIALYDRATGSDHSALLKRWADRVRRSYLDSHGLLVQHTRRDGTPDAPGRGSGTALGVYFLSFLDDPISAQLWNAETTWLDTRVIGFGAEREYARGARGRGDVDSGPLVFGLSPVATGFSIAGARLHGDRDRFARLYASAELVGAPLSIAGKERFVYGGPVGDAILFAMLTAQPPKRVHR